MSEDDLPLSDHDILATMRPDRNVVITGLGDDVLRLAEKGKLIEPCPYWADGIHCYAQWTINEDGSVVPDWMHGRALSPPVGFFKRCQCGARVETR